VGWPLRAVGKLSRRETLRLLFRPRALWPPIRDTRGFVRTAIARRLTDQMKRIVFLALALPMIFGYPAKAQLPAKKVLTLEVAKKIAAAAEAEAKKRGATVVIVVVDDGGHLLLLERLDDTQVASVEVGIGKARTAAIFRRPSKVFEDQVRDGRVAALALPGATPLQGGIPVEFEGKVIGAIGVSGNTPQEDEDIAKVGAASAGAAIGQFRAK
jgi:glc operon protein GlcG